VQGAAANATCDNEQLLCRFRIPDKPNILGTVITEHQKHLEGRPVHCSWRICGDQNS